MSSEFEKIAMIQKALGKPSSQVKTGIGDDTAVLEQIDGQILFSSDAMVEGIHFDQSYCTPRDIGHKALGSAFSDIAAMGGEPLAAVISLALPQSTTDSWLADFYKGASTLAQRIGADIVGGDLSRSPSAVFIDVAVLGKTTSPALSRRGAKLGDLLAVSGLPGSSHAGLLALRKKISSSFAEKHLRPEPRFDLARQLIQHTGLCSALIDLSDGVGNAVARLSEASQVGFEIEENLMPRSIELSHFAQSLNQDAKDWFLSGGEDYELLATLSPDLVEKHGLPSGFTIIGRVTTAEGGIQLVSRDGRKSRIEALGFDHFSEENS
jgi:thiamine-monophosphate kinase